MQQLLLIKLKCKMTQHGDSGKMHSHTFTCKLLFRPLTITAVNLSVRKLIAREAVETNTKEALLRLEPW